MSIRSFAAIATLAIAFAPASRALATPRSPMIAQRDVLHTIIDRYYAEYPRFHPTAATELGLHAYDGELEDVSAQAQLAESARLRQWDARLAAITGAKLDVEDEIDLRTLRTSIASQLVELEDIQGWRHRPDVYPGLASRSLYAIIKRDFAPESERLERAVEREQKIPAMLAAGKKNLQTVSKISVEIALEEIPGIIDFFDKDVPRAFPHVDDAHKAKLAESTRKVHAALDDYLKFVKTELAPRATAPIAIGEALFRKKLAADEMIDTPLDELLARGQAELERLQGEFRATAQKIDAKKSAAEVQKLMQSDHPAASGLIADVQHRLDGLRKFLVDRAIVTLPSEVMPRVEETPPFMRATTLASMETPGPFETRATEAFYNVTLPEEGWTRAQIEDYLAGAFSRPTIDVTSIHEAFPGHYVQFLWVPRLHSKVRKFEDANTNSEGWAHYCEQMMLDEGFGNGDPKERLAQLQDALLRAARFVVGIRMHARGMSFTDAVDFFEKQGYQQHKVAEMEARRGTEDPTYLYYTLGKLEILKLRDDYKRKLGAAYSLRKFHDAFLAEGPIPLPLMREALLGN